MGANSPRKPKNALLSPRKKPARPSLLLRSPGTRGQPKALSPPLSFGDRGVPPAFHGQGAPGRHRRLLPIGSMAEGWPDPQNGLFPPKSPVTGHEAGAAAPGWGGPIAPGARSRTDAPSPSLLQPSPATEETSRAPEVSVRGDRAAASLAASHWCSENI